MGKNYLDASNTVLEIRNLRTYFFTKRGIAKAVDGVSLKIHKKETVGLVGESGCGKTVTSLSVLQLIPNPPGKIVEGEVLFKNKDLLKLSNDEIRKIRGKKISMIFQEPLTSLNPVFTIGNQLSECFILHQNMNKKEALQQSIEILRLVGIPTPEKRISDYPHQLSGGMQQRVMIAMALSCNPELLIADEPTTALDVTIQAQILDLINQLKERLGTSIIMVTHNLGLVAEMADRVVVMYAGKIIEEGNVVDIFKNPLHPYTKGLLNSIPHIEKYTKKGMNKKRLQEIKGVVPNLYALPRGCLFNPRCPMATGKCSKEEPNLVDIGNGHRCSCWRVGEYGWKRLSGLQI